MTTFTTAFRNMAFAAALSASLLAPPAAPQGRFRILATFPNQALPTGLAWANGVLYATSIGPTPAGTNCGMLFELLPPSSPGGAWTQTVLYTFADTNDLCDPVDDPLVAPDGALYGLAGGLYKLEPPSTPGGLWTETVLYNFGTTGNLYPVGGLIRGPGGSFYFLGDPGVNGNGALAQLLPPTAPGGAWTATILYSLPGPATMGPPNSLTAGPNGVLYVTADYGSYRGPLGVVRQLTPPATPGEAWTDEVVYDFGSGNGGVGNPYFLTVASDGALYGAAYGFNLNGAGGNGGIFALTPPASPDGGWGYTVLKNFGHLHPYSPLVLRNGNVYGALDGNGEGTPGGAVFELQPPPAAGGAWTTTYLHKFIDSQIPNHFLVMGGGGTLYGTTLGSPASIIYAVTTQ